MKMRMRNQINTVGKKQVAILIIIFLGIVGLCSFFLYLYKYKTNQLGLGITPARLLVSNGYICSKDADCVTGIQVTTCCSCLEAVNKELIGTKDWE